MTRKILLCTLKIIYLLSLCVSAARIDKLDRRTLAFIQEPTEHVDFYNTTGAEIPCTARGSPPPTIRWETRDGSPVKDVPGLRHVRPDGSLVFPPFHSDNYRQDVHAAVYRCTASNSAGTIGSREVHVRGKQSLHCSCCGHFHSYLEFFKIQRTPPYPRQQSSQDIFGRHTGPSQTAQINILNTFGCGLVSKSCNESVYIRLNYRRRYHIQATAEVNCFCFSLCTRNDSWDKWFTINDYSYILDVFLIESGLSRIDPKASSKV